MDVRTIGHNELDAFRTALITTFGDEPDLDADGPRRMRALLPEGRVWAAFDGSLIVGTAATFALSIAVPGATLPIAGLTQVTVRPTHRRRGLLRALFDCHLQDARAHGEFVSGLWASEAPIYGRFGFGIAAEADDLRADLAGVAVAAGHALDSVAWVEEAEARQRLPAIYAAATTTRPGALQRSELWWRERRFLEHPHVRGDASRQRFVVVTRGGADVGYLVFRQKLTWKDSIPSGTTRVVELIATDAAAEATLWNFIAGIDLFPRVEWGFSPVDASLPWLVADPRRIERRRTDTLWLRIDDICAALSARHYAHDGVVDLAVDGNHYHLETSGGRGTCKPVEPHGRAVVELTRAALSSIFLGGIQASTLARATLVRGPASSIRSLDEVFAWPVAPWCPEVF